MKKVLILAMFFLMGIVVSVSQADIIRWEIGDGGNGHLYEAIYVPEGISWAAANTAATAKDGNWHLATATSAEENSFIYNLVDENKYWRFVGNHGLGPWIGGDKSGGSWQWVTGEPMSYTHWGPAEPFGNGNRIGLFGYYQLKGSYWNDAYDSHMPTGYIIETVPEPASVALLALGTLALLKRKRQRNCQ